MIVVIAVLAAISVVAYSGIQQRARESAMKSTLASVVKKIELYKIEHGSIPRDASVAPELNVKFPYSPVGLRVALCADEVDNPSVFGVAAYASPANDRLYGHKMGWGAPRQITPGTGGSAASNMCGELGLIGYWWGSFWVQGG